ncbi:hypothetical protein NEOLEDRAFT_1137682 [Neolentinus lepideus HHB14362 ss-1]|uniref:Uncharacterized protein n=1 Tax=Neolentinus lepideus HHB14362 ss-1 TaxID=1314782 RepID=A0A165QNL0_9AGAM|nr:hypothetical protein NEOLEDRAFT_1137682 [Neolentinus lepideus HHB14362 ss-1]
MLCECRAAEDRQLDLLLIIHLVDLVAGIAFIFLATVLPLVCFENGTWAMRRLQSISRTTHSDAGAMS